MLNVLLILMAISLLSVVAVIAYIYHDRTYAEPKIYSLEFLDQPSLGPYYMNLDHKLVDYPNRDAHGGILETYENQEYFHPIRNTHYAFALYARYLDNDIEDDKNEFLRIADAIVANGIKRDDGARVWHYPQSFFPGQETPWISAMAQGQIIAVMARAYECTNNESYLKVAHEAFLPFLKPIADGGVRSDDQLLGIFYEEFAHKECYYQHHTLNGMLSALFGLYDYWKLTGREEVRDAFDLGVATIRRNLVHYDKPFCSTYDLRHVIGNVPPLLVARYHAVHVGHLHILSAMTEDGYFDGVADCWSRKLGDKINRLRLAVAYLIWRGHRLLKRSLQRIKS